MGFCAQTSCGKAYMKWKTIKEMNAKGIYTPEQITDTIDKNWDAVNPDGKSTVTQDECKKVAEDSINYLGSIGDGATFDTASYDSKKKFAGIILNIVKKEQIIAVVTALLAKTE